MKGCLSVVGGVIGVFLLLGLMMGAGSSPPPSVPLPVTAAAAAPAAPVAHAAAPARPTRRHRRHRRHAAAANPNADPRAAVPTFHLAHIDHWNEDEIGMVHVYGTAVNNTDHELSYAQLTLRLLDKHGDQVGTVLANTTTLPAGARWRFDAMGSGAGAVRLAMGDETAY